MGVSEDIAERLIALPASSAVALQVGTDIYFEVMRGVVDRFASKKGLDMIYISSSIPATSIINALQVLEIELSRVYFIDCISYTMMGASAKPARVLYIESPSMLETIMLKTEFLLRKCRSAEKIVFIDSINSLAIHSNTRLLSEFFHLLVNNLRAKNTYTIILSIEEHASQEITNLLNMVCDETIIVERGK